MRLTLTLCWLAGLVLVVLLVAWQGAAEVGRALAVAGWSVLAVAPVHILMLTVDTLGWRQLLEPAARVGLPAMVAMRWIGSAVSTLLPVAQVGGDIVRARLLAQSGVRGAVAGGSVVVDLTLGVLTLAMFAATALVLLLAHASPRFDGTSIGLGIGGLFLLGLAFLVAQRQGLFLRLATALERAAGGADWLRLAGGAEALDRAIAEVHRNHRALLHGGALRLLGWLGGGFEIWLIFLILGHPVSLLEALILEGIGQAARSAAFVVPGGLGAQEGGIVAAAAWLHLPAEVAVAGALIKRAREIVYGVLGLAAWSLMESRRLGFGRRS